MIQVIYGNKGSGKTKRILDIANDRIGFAKGTVIFIDDDDRYLFDLHHEIRFVNASEYGIVEAKVFLGFIEGMAARDFDLEIIFVDGFLRIVKEKLETLADFFEQVVRLSEKKKIDFVFSVSGNPAALPDFLKPYVI